MMRLWSRDVILAVLSALALLAGLAAGAWWLLVPAPGAESSRPGALTQAQLQHEVRGLARANRFDEAQKLVSRFLDHEPGNDAARLMLAELALDRPDPQPELALEQVRAIKAEDKVTASQARLDEGKADYKLSRFDEAETAWKEALRLNPTIPEAGWSLLDLYYIEGRAAEARRLGLQLFGVEPDAHDQAQLLLELVRQDAQPADPASVVKLFVPVLERGGHGLHTRLALGLALVKDNRADEGLALLGEAVASHPEDADARDALLTGLGAANRIEGLARAVEQLPKALADSARFAKHKGRVAWDKRDWKAAVEAYRTAVEAEPDNHEVLYRLGGALRSSGDVAAAEPIEGRARAFEAARGQIGALYEEANAVKTLGTEPHADLYGRLADLRERMGRYEEARAWLQLILRQEPFDEKATAALKRLDAQHPRHAEASSSP